MAITRVGAATIGLAAHAPDVRTGAAVQVPAASVEVQAHAPAVVLGAVVEVPAAVLVIAGVAPEIITARGIVHVPAAALEVTAYPPTLDVGAPNPLRRIALTGAANDTIALDAHLSSTQAMTGRLIRKVS